MKMQDGTVNLSISIDDETVRAIDLLVDFADQRNLPVDVWIEDSLIDQAVEQARRWLDLAVGAFSPDGSYSTNGIGVSADELELAHELQKQCPDLSWPEALARARRRLQATA